ncbi:MAG: GTPase Era [Acidobacteriota bacterium]|nr:GTPase Era [Acidobacteriota bacterium]
MSAAGGPATDGGEGRSHSPYRCGFVAIVGRANVGKSTLINQLVGLKIAIVSTVPQTTRQRIVGVRTLDEGQIVFLDTPGFHRPRHRLGDILLDRARQTLAEADVLLFVVDAADGVGPGDRFVLEQLDARRGDSPVVFVPNKLDRMNKGRVLPMIEEAMADWGCSAAVPVSAETGDNCDRLIDTVVALLPEGPPLYPRGFTTDQGESRIVAELIREKLLHRLRQELPHAVAVRVDDMMRRDDDLLQIHATIFVERKSQKGIVIGHRGAMLKEVGTAARKELEDRLSEKIFLELWVKVREDWRDRPAELRDLGVFLD